MMYSDEKTWNQHYVEWLRILPSIDKKKATDLFRRKIIEGLIKDYEVMNSHE